MRRKMANMTTAKWKCVTDAVALTSTEKSAQKVLFTSRPTSIMQKMRCCSYEWQTQDVDYSMARADICTVEMLFMLVYFNSDLSKELQKRWSQRLIFRWIAKHVISNSESRINGTDSWMCSWKYSMNVCKLFEYFTEYWDSISGTQMTHFKWLWKISHSSIRVGN